LANSSAKSRTTARSSNVANAASFDDELLLVCNVSVSSFFFPLLSRCSLSSPLSVNRSAIASFLVNKNLPRRPPLLKTNKDSDGPFFFFFFFREALRSSRHPRGGKVFVFATAAVVVVFPTEEEEHALVADERNILFESFFSRLFSLTRCFVRKNARVSVKSNVSHILIPRESVPRQTTRELSDSRRMKKRKKNNTNSWLCSFSLVFFVRFSFSLFFVTCQRSRSFTFSTPQRREFSSVSFPRYNKMQSIQSTVVVEVRFKFSLSFKLSFKLSFFTSFVENVLFCLSRPSSLSKASFFLWKVALRDD